MYISGLAINKDGLERCQRFLSTLPETLNIDVFTCILVGHKVMKSTLELLRRVSQSYTSAPFIRVQLVAYDRIRSASIYLFFFFVISPPSRNIP